MKIIVDFNKCRGYGSCVIEAPEVFDFDEDENKVILIEETPSETKRTKTEKAVRSCPARALAVIDE